MANLSIIGYIIMPLPVEVFRYGIQYRLNIKYRMLVLIYKFGEVNVKVSVIFLFFLNDSKSVGG